MWPERHPEPVLPSASANLKLYEVNNLLSGHVTPPEYPGRTFAIYLRSLPRSNPQEIGQADLPQLINFTEITVKRSSTEFLVQKMVARSFKKNLDGFGD